MILDLARKLSKVDSSLSISINYSEDGVATFTIDAMDGFGSMYSYSSTDTAECYKKMLEFIECLKDSDKFFNLLREIEKEPLEV